MDICMSLYFYVDIVVLDGVVCRYVDSGWSFYLRVPMSEIRRARPGVAVPSWPSCGPLPKYDNNTNHCTVQLHHTASLSAVLRS